MNRVDGYAKAVWEAGENCSNVRFYDADGSEVEIDSLNLARDVRTDMSGWSDWLTPVYNSKNSIQNIGTTNLGLKKKEMYTRAQSRLSSRAFPQQKARIFCLCRKVHRMASGLLGMFGTQI